MVSQQQKQPHQEERRSGEERRRWTCHHAFPYIDGHGILVTEERRIYGNRRCVTQRSRRRRQRKVLFS